MADQQNRSITEATDPSDQSLIITATTVTMQLDPVITEHLDEVESAGPMRMTGNLNFLRRAQRAEYFVSTARRQCLELQQLLTDIHL